MKSAPDICAEWLAVLRSTEPADRARTQAALRELYLASELPAPGHFFWCDSPYAALWAMALVSAEYDALWKRIVEAMGRYKRERELMDRVRTAMCQSAALPDWKSLAAAAGQPMALFLMYQSHQRGQPLEMIQSAVTLARIGLYENVNDSIPPRDDSNDLYRLEHSMHAVLSGQAGWSTINSLMSASFGAHYSFSAMAKDEDAASQKAPPILPAAWAVARAAGMWWWPLANSVVLSERPTEMHLNERLVPHRSDGPALVFPDGLRVWAWNGKAMREEWITHPEGISARDLKQFDPTFRAFASSRTKSAPPAAKKVRASSILKVALPSDSDERVALLRKHNKGTLPLFDRYAAGEHEKVWEELIALGPSVRSDPYAADALAVAYETMRRVELNVREVTARLRAIGYRFAYDDDAHDPPDPKIRRQIARLEKKIGAIPLSLRAFYEIVGMVNWMGEHGGIAPRDSAVAPDPLVVFPIEGALVDGDESFEDGEGVIDIAPDDLHKSNTSGGDPYQIAVPDLCADGRLLNERHDLYFVQYLRMVFRFGGFPGYDGVDVAVPQEIATLRDGLLPF